MSKLAEGQIRTSTGVVLAVKKAPAMAFQAINAKWRKLTPRPPVVHIENKGRDEENPNDPKYLDEVAEHKEAMSAALYDAAVLLCTSIVSIPEGMAKVDEDSWLDDLQELGIEFDKSRKNRRYVAWVKYYAAPTLEDMAALQLAISRRNGVAEEDVASALASYKSGTGRDADREVQATGLNIN